jgi:ferredoxin
VRGSRAHKPPIGVVIKIHLDTEKCQGHGRCYSLAPDLFDCDDLGTAVVVVAGDLNDEQLAKAKLAAGNCPEFAITIGD